MTEVVSFAAQNTAPITRLVTTKIRRMVQSDSMTVPQTHTLPPAAPSSTVTQEAGQVIDFFAAEMFALQEELLKRTQQLEEANRRLEELSQAKSRMMGDVAHELRAPLASMLLKIDLLERGNITHHGRYIGDMRQQVRRLTEMIENLLDLSRVETTNPHERFREVNINNLAQECVKAHQDAARQKGLELRLLFQHAEQARMVRGESEQLTRVLDNLLGNAIKYTQTGSVAVLVHWDTPAARVGVIMRDTGLGIAEEDIPHLFERFHRGRIAEAARIEGSGLGLAIVKEIVTQHNGSIEVESEVGVGSCFRVWLPTR
jgi:signal transduction histidine kinase